MRVICLHTNEHSTAGRVITIDKTFEVADITKVIWDLLHRDTPTLLAETGDIVIFEWWESLEDLGRVVEVANAQNF